MSYEKFSANNAAMLLIGHQGGTMGWVKSMSLRSSPVAGLRLKVAS